MPTSWKLGFLVAHLLALTLVNAELDNPQYLVPDLISAEPAVYLAGYKYHANEHLAKVIVRRQEEENNVDATTTGPVAPEPSPEKQISTELSSPEDPATATAPGDSQESIAASAGDDAPQTPADSNAPEPEDPRPTTAAEDNHDEEPHPPTSNIPRPEETAPIQKGDNAEPQAPGTIKVAKVSPGSKPYSAVHKGGKVNYWYEVSWVEGCKTTVDSQDVAYPINDKGPRCTDIFKSAFKSCDNGDVGGYIEAG
ncbi:uncharacterized protein FTOL_12166 [Fusarium torulosum]|uniref:Uncharacterized protein n=1 Tax=Fusarium torulosum TaxID=33205 RepID=A0AAE8SNM0_9HYPO|nr:uncharacterized protein FTOL_12166 [Fusarium torulosum]